MSIKCKKCKVKTGICGITCKYCGQNFCVRCSHLEAHSCEGIEKSKEVHKNKLEKTLAYTQAKKHDFNC